MGPMWCSCTAAGWSRQGGPLGSAVTSMLVSTWLLPGLTCQGEGCSIASCSLSARKHRKRPAAVNRSLSLTFTPSLEATFFSSSA